MGKLLLIFHQKWQRLCVHLEYEVLLCINIVSFEHLAQMNLEI